jgi:hypothetical protein
MLRATRLISRIATLALVLVGLCFSDQSLAQLNCATQQCVQVRFFNNGQNRNKYCWIDDTGTVLAYSTTFAVTGYGQDSKGGTPKTQVSGWTIVVNNATHDCDTTPKPLSGTVNAYGSTVANTDFLTVCPGS